MCVPASWLTAAVSLVDRLFRLRCGFCQTHTGCYDEDGEKSISPALLHSFLPLGSTRLTTCSDAAGTRRATSAFMTCFHPLATLTPSHILRLCPSLSGAGAGRSVRGGHRTAREQEGRQPAQGKGRKTGRPGSDAFLPLAGRRHFQVRVSAAIGCAGATNAADGVT